MVDRRPWSSIVVHGFVVPHLSENAVFPPHSQEGAAAPAPARQVGRSQRHSVSQCREQQQEPVGSLSGPQEQELSGPQEQPHPTDTPPSPKCQLAHLDRQAGSPPNLAPATVRRRTVDFNSCVPGQHLGTVDRPLTRRGARTGEYGRHALYTRQPIPWQGEFYGVPWSTMVDHALILFSILSKRGGKEGRKSHADVRHVGA